MSIPRELRLEIFTTVHDFLEAKYDCECPRTDPDGSHTAEAGRLARAVLDSINVADIWDMGYSAGFIDGSQMKAISPPPPIRRTDDQR